MLWAELASWFILLENRANSKSMKTFFKNIYLQKNLLGILYMK